MALSAFDYYASWSGESAAELFRAVASLTSTASYAELLAAAALLGLIGAAGAACVRARGGDIAVWFFSLILLYFAFFVPRVTVNVIDPRSLSAQAVANVPLGAGFLASASSSVGRWMAEAFEAAFADVDAEKFTRFGAAFPERVVAAIHNAGPITPEAREALSGWVERCVAPEAAGDDAKLRELLASPDLLSTVSQPGWMNPARFMLSASGERLFCPDALSEVKRILAEKEIPKQESALMMRLAGTENAMMEAALREAVPEAQALLLGTSRSMAESLAHSLLLTAVPEGLSRYAARSESPIAAAVQLSKAQGNLSSEISFRTMGELAATQLPKIRSILEFIVIGAFPIVFLMAAALGNRSAAALRMYATLFFWLALWAPLASIVNFLIIRHDANPMNRLIEAYGGATLQAADFIRDAGASSQAMAGWAMLLVPAMAFMIARASEMGAASLAGSLMQPAASAASAQSASLSMGNASAGNASIGNITAGNAQANKADWSSSFAEGTVHRRTTAYGSVIQDAESGLVSGASVNRVNLGLEVTSQAGAGAARDAAYSESAAFTSGRTLLSAHESSALSRSEAGWQTASGTASTSARSESQTLASSEGEAAASSLSSTRSLSLASGARAGEAIALQSSLGAAGGLGIGIGRRASAAPDAVESENGIDRTTLEEDAATAGAASALLSGAPTLQAAGGGARRGSADATASLPGGRGLEASGGLRFGASTTAAQSDGVAEALGSRSASAWETRAAQSRSSSSSRLAAGVHTRTAAFHDSESSASTEGARIAQSQTDAASTARSESASERRTSSVSAAVAMDLGNLQSALVNHSGMTPDEALRYYHDPAHLQVLQSVLSGYLEKSFSANAAPAPASAPQAVEPYAALEERSAGYDADRAASEDWAAARAGELRAAGEGKAEKLAGEPLSNGSPSLHAGIQSRLQQAKSQAKDDAAVQRAAADRYREEEIGLAAALQLSLGPAFNPQHNPIEKADAMAAGKGSNSPKTEK